MNSTLRWVLGAGAAISLLGIVAVTRGTETAPAAQMSAAVKFEPDAVVITNTGKDVWREPRLTLEPGGYHYATDEQIQPGQTLRATWPLFANEAGVRFNVYRVKPARVTVAARLNSVPTSQTYGFPE